MLHCCIDWLRVAFRTWKNWPLTAIDNLNTGQSSFRILCESLIGHFIIKRIKTDELLDDSAVFSEGDQAHIIPWKTLFGWFIAHSQDSSDRNINFQCNMVLLFENKQIAISDQGCSGCLRSEKQDKCKWINLVFDVNSVKQLISRSTVQNKNLHPSPNPSSPKWSLFLQHHYRCTRRTANELVPGESGRNSLWCILSTGQW